MKTAAFVIALIALLAMAVKLMLFPGPADKVATAVVGLGLIALACLPLHVAIR